MRVTQVTPDVVEVRILRSNIHAVLEEQVTLIDAGLPGSRAGIAEALAGHGRTLADVARVVCTHGHPDHAGGAAALAPDGAAILIHPADAALLPTRLGDVVRRPARGRLFAALTPAPASTSALADGDVLPVLGGLEVIHTPGHTPGSVCLWAARDGLLFTGDLLQRRFGRIICASSVFSDDVRAARRSVQRLAALDVNTIIFGHDPPMRAGGREAIARLAREAARL
jgi:glyoxylase-like metal-dependent hydrolase (beta-lactamase superfamily II)